MTGEMEVVDHTGHTKITWDTENPAERENAKSTFDSMVKKGYRAFRVTGGGKEGERMHTFDPHAGAMILMVAPIQGG